MKTDSFKAAQRAYDAQQPPEYWEEEELEEYEMYVFYKHNICNGECASIFSDVTCKSFKD